MPQLGKGGKWVFGWVHVNLDRSISIPPEAWAEYGFEEGVEVVLLRGSASSVSYTHLTLPTKRIV